MSDGGPAQILPLDALAEPAALLESGTLRVLHANRALLAIEPGAAILGVADAYDAMTVARPYSAPLPAAEALEECRRLSGAQFDPDAVAALETVLDRTAEDSYPSRWGSRTS